MQERRSTNLASEDWERLETLAASTNSTASAGPEYGKPSWRALLRRICRNERILSFIEAELTQHNKAMQRKA